MDCLFLVASQAVPKLVCNQSLDRKRVTSFLRCAILLFFFGASFRGRLGCHPGDSSNHDKAENDRNERDQHDLDQSTGHSCATLRRRPGRRICDGAHWYDALLTFLTPDTPQPNRPQALPRRLNTRTSSLRSLRSAPSGNRR
ncbi:hypothetical protein G6F35_017801 [Rhizopus arrhizus]|nr:hypothetical protein G6F35_017801 [Rhizopus arrhizus]